MVPTTPRTPCDCSQKTILSDNAPSIRGEETSPSQGVPDQSFSDTHMDKLSNSSEIQRVQEAIEDLYHCRCPLSDDQTFSLDEESFDKLRRNLEAKNLLWYFDEQVRSDWNPGTGELTLRTMPPTQFHERTWELLVEAIKKELDRLANNLPNLAEHRRNVVPCGSARLSASTDPVSSGWKSPDSQFQYKGVPGSTFVIEIACSQHPNDLRNKIKDYFMLLPSVCTVLAIDIDCKASVAVRQDPQYKHAAKVLLWAREKVQDNKQTIRCYKNVIFRPGDRGRVPPGELTIPFKFFLPQVKRDNTAAQDEELIFPYPSLAAWIEEAENDDRVQSTAPLPPPKRQLYDFIYEDGTVEEEVYEPKVQTRKC